jgi:hypothetical protein
VTLHSVGRPQRTFEATLSAMADQTMSAPRSPRWVPPPWSIPKGRRPSLRRRLIGVPPLSAMYMSVLLTWTVARPLPATDPFLVVTDTVMAVLVGLGAILAVGYGVLIIATAGWPRLKPVWFFAGLTSTPTAARWLGVAFLFPQAIVWAIAVVAHFTLIGPSPTSLGPPSALFFIVGYSIALSPALGMLCFIGCCLLARRAANRPIKQAILSGLAPSYYMASGLFYWWDGERWRAVAEAAPEGALRSPDGHYWWNGEYWVPMPPDHPSRDLLKVSVA